MTKQGSPSDSSRRHSPSLEDEQAWMDKESAACNFRDERLKKRFRLLLQQFWSGMGQTIPFACQDWASTKAAYRFFANVQVCEQDILSGHFRQPGSASQARLGRSWSFRIRRHFLISEISQNTLDSSARPRCAASL